MIQHQAMRDLLGRPALIEEPLHLLAQPLAPGQFRDLGPARPPRGLFLGPPGPIPSPGPVRPDLPGDRGRRAPEPRRDRTERLPREQAAGDLLALSPRQPKRRPEPRPWRGKPPGPGEQTLHGLRRAAHGCRQESVVAHQPQHPLAAHGQTPMSQPSPDIPVTLAVKGTGGQDRPDRGDKHGIGMDGLRPALAAERRWPRLRGGGVHARAWHSEGGAQQRASISLAGARTEHATHRLDFFHSSASPLFSMRYSASSSRINSLVFARASGGSRSSGSTRLFSPRAPCSRSTRFQPSSSCPGTWPTWAKGRTRGRGRRRQRARSPWSPS